MKKYIYMICASLVAVFLAACDDKNDSGFVPSEPTPAGCMQVFFNKSNPTEFVLQPGETKPITIEVSRKDTAETAEVPIVCKYADSALEIPKTVKFEKGDSVAAITIGYSNLEMSKTYAFSLAVAEGYADHYSIQDGATVYSGSVMQTVWEVAKEDVKIYYPYGGSYLTWTTNMERLKGTGRYRIKDFLGSGLDFVFTADKYSTEAGYMQIEPYTNFSDDVTDSYSAYYLYDTANDQWPSWDMAEGVHISYLSFLRSYGDADYSYISFDEGYAQLCTSYVEYGDGNSESYTYVLMYF